MKTILNLWLNYNLLPMLYVFTAIFFFSGFIVIPLAIWFWWGSFIPEGGYPKWMNYAARVLLILAYFIAILSPR